MIIPKGNGARATARLSSRPNCSREQNSTREIGCTNRHGQSLPMLVSFRRAVVSLLLGCGWKSEHTPFFEEGERHGPLGLD
jgi:hypothetical protein